MATRKISELSSIGTNTIFPQSAVLPLVNGGETFKVTINELVDSAGTIDLGAKGHLIAQSGSFQYITASLIDVDAETIRIGGVPFSRTDVDNLKAGRSLSKVLGKQLVNANDSTTYVRMQETGRAVHYVSDRPAIDIKTDKVVIGGLDGTATGGGLPVVMPGPTTISGSLSQTGSVSFNTSGSSQGFAVNNLLDLLANFGQTGIPTGSEDGAGVASGDINLDGQVNINDLLLLLAGYGNPNTICNDQIIPPNVNHQFVGPTISVCEGSVLSIATGSFCSITN